MNTSFRKIQLWLHSPSKVWPYIAVSLVEIIPTFTCTKFLIILIKTLANMNNFIKPRQFDIINAYINIWWAYLFTFIYYKLALFLPSLFTTCLFRTFHNKSHNMKALVRVQIRTLYHLF